MMTIESQTQRNIHSSERASWRQYAMLAVGRESFWLLFCYEVAMSLLGGLSGALGLWARRKVYPLFLGSCGRKPIFGRRVVIRGADKVFIGDHVAFDDYVVIDARGADGKIVIEDGVLISRNTVVRARNGTITIGSHADVGTNCILATDSQLQIGKYALIAAYTYVTAGGNHNYADLSVPMARQGFTSKGGVVIGDDVWIGSHTTVMDGVTIGAGAIIGSHSLVNKDLDPAVIAWGVPAEKRRTRGTHEEAE